MTESIKIAMKASTEFIEIAMKSFLQLYNFTLIT